MGKKKTKTKTKETDIKTTLAASHTLLYRKPSRWILWAFVHAYSIIDQRLLNRYWYFWKWKIEAGTVTAFDDMNPRTFSLPPGGMQNTGQEHRCVVRLLWRVPPHPRTLTLVLEWLSPHWQNSAWFALSHPYSLACAWTGVSTSSPFEGSELRLGLACFRHRSSTFPCGLLGLATQLAPRSAPLPLPNRGLLPPSASSPFGCMWRVCLGMRIFLFLCARVWAEDDERLVWQSPNLIAAIIWEGSGTRLFEFE